MLAGLFESKRKLIAPEWIENYNELKFKHPRNTPISAITFCALDCETTGLGNESDVISIGAVKFKNNRIKVDDSLDLRFTVSKGQKQSEIHEELVQEITLDKQNQYQRLLEYLGNTVIIGHHIRFDIYKISQMISRSHAGFALKNKSVDTFALMQRIDPMRLERNVGGSKSMKLDALCKEFDIDIENRHTALGDAYLAAQLFIKQLRQLKKRKVTKIGML